MAHLFIPNNHVVQGIASVDINSSGADGIYVNMKLYRQITILLNFGVIGAATAVTLKQATDVSGTDEKELAFTDMFAKEGTTTDLHTETVVTGNTFNTGTTNNSMYKIEVSANQLDINNDFGCVRVALSDPGASTIVGCEYVLSQPRYSSIEGTSAIID
jgi:hypothetical protein